MSRPKGSKNKKKADVSQKITPAFAITLKLGETTIGSYGASVLEALESLQRPVKIVSKGVLTVQKEDKSWSQTLMPWKIKRYFYPMAQIYLAKQLEFMIK